MDFFAPTGILLPAGSGWIIQTSTPGKGSQRASGIGATGDEVANALYDTRETLTETYKLFTGTGTLPVLGTVIDTSLWHIDSMSVSLSATDWPTMTITAHKHTDGVGHASMETYTPSISAPAAAWGVPEAPFGITVGTLTTVGVSSAEYNFSVTHVDELAGDGKQLGGQNRDGVETLSVTYVGTTTPAGPDGWDEMETGTNTSNEAASGGSAAWEHHVTADAED
jgi:hypothetical protein